MPPKISPSTLLLNTQTELKQSVSKLLTFFQDDRGKNLLRSFAALSQCYIDLRSVCLFGASTTATSSSASVSSSGKKGLSQQQENGEEVQETFSIVYSPSKDRLENTKDKIRFIQDRIDSIVAASASLLNELLQLLNRVKELTNNTYLAAFNVIYNNNSSSSEGQQPQQRNTNNTSTTKESGVINVHLRLLKDVLETLVNNQLQNKIVTIHVIFNEVKSCVSFSSDHQEIRWKLTLDQLRVYQTALTAEFTALSLAGSGSAGSAQQHPLESIPSLLDRVGNLCGKIGS